MVYRWFNLPAAVSYCRWPFCSGSTAGSSLRNQEVAQGEQQACALTDVMNWRAGRGAQVCEQCLATSATIAYAGLSHRWHSGRKPFHALVTSVSCSGESVLQWHQF